MRIGIRIGTGPVDPGTLRATLAAADTLGYHSVWARASGHPDRRDPAPTDPLAVAGYAAGVSRNVHLGTGALPAWRHRPEVLARVLVSLHRLSGERLVVGVLLGDGAARRADAVALLDAFEPAAGGGPRPPVLLAGLGAGDLGLVAERADGWLVDADERDAPSTSEIGARWSLVRGRAAATGRDPRHLRLVVGIEVPADDSGVADVAERARDLARLGADEVVLATSGCLDLDEMLGRYAAVAEGLFPDGRLLGC